MPDCGGGRIGECLCESFRLWVTLLHFLLYNNSRAGYLFTGATTLIEESIRGWRK